MALKTYFQQDRGRWEGRGERSRIGFGSNPRLFCLGDWYDKFFYGFELHKLFIDTETADLRLIHTDERR